MTPDFRPGCGAVTWRTSSYSNGQGGDCVEAADGFPGVLPVRDGKRPQGPVLVFRASAWFAFVNELKANPPA
ncbi:DUF397 domain-containing protein [Streptomyces griseolus]|uniref:DUF397 domain-containing protein n=1 Tax=Streptomyces griseolus TaxID=1909 RepID=UPI002242DC4E|nr:DUF397 domain-containing protein [Streptomyces griseolus]MCW8219040.1 DUF397 domain-containing protein [Streptomyces griseolus]